MSNLEGKVVAVTGAARGIGRAIVKGFLAEGAKVIALDMSWTPSGLSGDDNDDYVKELKVKQEDVLISTVDISDSLSVERSYIAAFIAALDKFGTVDTLVNNASLRQRNLFPPTGKITTLETKDSDWEKCSE